MSSSDVVLRFLVKLVQHPHFQAGLHHAIRMGTAELIRHVRNRTRSRTPPF